MGTIGVALVWAQAPSSGRVAEVHCRVRQGRVAAGVGVWEDVGWRDADGPLRLELTVADEGAGLGAGAARLTVWAVEGSFSVFLRDVTSQHPIVIPAYGVAVLPAADPRGYAEVLADVQARGALSQLERIAADPEEGWEGAAAAARELRAPIWLGLGRDMRIFELGLRVPGGGLYESILPRWHGDRVTLPETDGTPVSYAYLLGRGWGAVDRTRRWLDQGVLPIWRQARADGPMLYDLTAWCTLEATTLTPEAVRGTHFLAADAHAAGHMFTPEQQADVDRLLAGEEDRPKETVLCLRVEAVNRGDTPAYAWLKAPWPWAAQPWSRVEGAHWDADAGLGLYASGRAYVAARLNGAPMPQEEVAVLVPPGQAVHALFLLPHRPIPRARALALASLDADASLESCRAYWRAKLDDAARLRLPERRFDEMARAGLLHLDLVAYGLEPNGPVAPTIGVYAPIGSESAPIIQFTDSMGRHDLAARMLDYFLEKQHADGFIQNFGGYMLETGCALWSLGEHWRYTRDRVWLDRVVPKVRKSARYLLDWRARGLTEERRGRGYGLLDGKVAAPEDDYPAYMLNAYAYLGLARTAEMLGAWDAEEGQRWAAEADALRDDILAAARQGLAEGPCIPLGDGSWAPTLAPFAGFPGPVGLYAQGGLWTSHGTAAARDSLLGPLYLAFCEVLAPDDPMTTMLLRGHAALWTERNAAFSQPYYSRHLWAHLARGEVKAFLKGYYTTVASLADRETYTFWEHHFHASPHKTHEEGWFLMQTRWMLYREAGETLHLLGGVPRAWLADGQEIALEGVASYYGPLDVTVRSEIERGRMVARVRCRDVGRRPARVALRLPHPQGRRAVAVDGGRYDGLAETAWVEPFDGEAELVARF